MRVRRESCGTARDFADFRRASHSVRRTPSELRAKNGSILRFSAYVMRDSRYVKRLMYLLSHTSVGRQMNNGKNRVRPTKRNQACHHWRRGYHLPSGWATRSGLTAKTGESGCRRARSSERRRPCTYPIPWRVQSDLLDRVVPMLGEVLVPVMQGERVVLAQVLLMHHVEAGVMDARFDEAGRAEITSGKM